MSALLRATTTAESDPGDPPPGSILSGFSSPDRSFWATGLAKVIEVPAPWITNLHVVSESLEAIDILDDVDVVGSGPIAFAALPFDTLGPGAFIIPSEIHGSDSEGRRWLTRVESTGQKATSGPDQASMRGEIPEPITGEPAADLAPPSGNIREPRSLAIRTTMDPHEWCRSVEAARGHIASEELTKVVLSREIVVEADTDFDPATIFLRLRDAYPNSMTFSVDGFVGASPELLVARSGDLVRAHPMAGTTPRSGDPAADQRRAEELIASEKNRVEHQITIDMVHNSVLPWCSYLDAEPTPSVVAAGPVQHLATIVEGRLSHPIPSVLDLVAALHPTPAVGGWPVEPALALIDVLEPSGRGRYAGPTGWVDARGNGAFAVSVRSAQLDGTTATLRAGVGIVADSDPLLELEETRTKARALLSILVRV